LLIRLHTGIKIRRAPGEKRNCMPRTSQSENSLIRRIQQATGHQARSGLRLGIGDDAALFSPSPGHQTVLSCDWFLEGTHFLSDRHPPDSVGWKCLARAVSDIAAMGGVPKCFLLSLALPNSRTQRWLDDFLRGLGRAARRFHCPLAGGDTTRRSEILISVAVTGEVQAGRALLRSGARPGDLIYVSGRLGEAELGFRLLRQARPVAAGKSSLLRKHLYPEPRLKLGRWLAEKRVATAMMDLSDGLSGDLPRLCAASQTGARLDMARLPTAEGTARAGMRGLDPVQLALHGGDDYELLFTVPRSKARQIPQSFNGCQLTAIGEITRQRQLLVETAGRARPLAAGGWDPFRKTR
jgi:thiamine-monophosphate kinase